MSKSKRFFAAAVSLILSLLILAVSGCSKSGEYYHEDNNGQEQESGVGGSSSEFLQNAVNRMIIYEYSGIIVVDDLQAAIDAVSAKFSVYEGYIESSSANSAATNSYNSGPQRTAEYVFRIKTASYEDFIADIGTAGRMEEEKRTTTDVTEAYFDLTAYKAAKEAEEARIFALYGQAATLSEITYLSGELSKIQHELNNINRDLSAYDSRLDFAKVSLKIVQYTNAAEPGFWQKIGNTFTEAGKGFVIFLQYLLIALIYVSPFGLTAFLIVFFCKRAAKKRRRMREMQQSNVTAQTNPL